MCIAGCIFTQNSGVSWNSPAHRQFVVKMLSSHLLPSSQSVGTLWGVKNGRMPPLSVAKKHYSGLVSGLFFFFFQFGIADFLIEENGNNRTYSHNSG